MSSCLSGFDHENTVKVKPREIESNGSCKLSPNSSSLESSEGYEDDFETESILDEEIGEGIDTIIGDSNSRSDFNYNTCYGYPVGLGFGGNLVFNFGLGLRNGVKALRNVDDRNWWRFPAVNVVKSELVEKLESLVVGEERLSVENVSPLLLKLNYGEVLKAWSGKGSRLPESQGCDTHAKLAQIDLFSENIGVREASVIRYKDKRRARFFSKKVRYEVRKVNADRRSRSKGRFVRRPNSPTCEET